MNKSTRTLALCVLFFAGTIPAGYSQQYDQDQLDKRSMISSYENKLGSKHLLFLENRGQITGEKGQLRPDVLFTAKNKAVKMFIKGNGIQYEFSRTEISKNEDVKNADITGKKLHAKQGKRSTHSFSVQLLGANEHPLVETGKQAGYTENFFLAGNPDGITGVRSFEVVRLKNVYPGIDWVLYTKGDFIEYDFLVHPGSNPDQIRIAVKDADKAFINEAEEIEIQTQLGVLKEKKPVSFAAGKTIASSFKMNKDGSFGFSLAAYDRAELLRIDPFIVWDSYYGGDNVDEGNDCAIDAAGNVYMAGYTASFTAIASGGFQNAPFGNGDAFLVKFDANGNRLWATYYGNTGDEVGLSCAVDGSNNVYLSGYTSSTSGIASGGFQNTNGGNKDAYLVKFNSAGSRLWSTYYGGQFDEQGTAVAVDAANNVYLAGVTNSSTNIASGGFQNTYVLTDAFLVKFNSSGSRLWGTYYGNSGDEYVFDCVVDKTGNVYIAGSTASATGIASPGAFQPELAAWPDAFLAKFSSSGSRLWATYYGGDWDDYAQGGCAVDRFNNVFMTGVTGSVNNIASPGSFQEEFGQYRDAFLVKFDSTGKRRWGTYYGASGATDFNGGNGCAADSAGNVYMVGQTSNGYDIASGGFQNSYSGGGGDAFIVKFDSTGGRTWGSYYGGSGGDASWGCVLDGLGNMYLTGQTNSGEKLPGFQPQNGGGDYDAFLAKINLYNPLYFFTGTGNWTDPQNWSDHTVPSATVPKGSVIVISPQPGGECVLNDLQTFAANSTLVIGAGAKFKVPGNIDVKGTGSQTGNITGYPTITSFTPVSGIVGTTVTLTGTNLYGAVVRFNGKPTTNISVSATTITCKVPAGASTGFVSVNTENAAAIGATVFTVLPAINSFTPVSGSVATTITIRGTSLAGAVVKFNGTTAVTSTVSDTVIVCTVPVGATTGTIAVTTASGTAVTASAFTVTAGGSNEVAKADLIAHWTFDNTRVEAISSTDASTIAGTSYNASGKIGACLDFNGGYLVYPTIPNINNATILSNGFTLSMWVKVPQQTLLTSLWQINGGINDIWGIVGFAYRKNPDGIMDLDGMMTHLNANGTHSTYTDAFLQSTSSGFIPGSNWALITMVYDDATRDIKYYANGQLRGSMNVNPFLVLPTFEKFTMTTTSTTSRNNVTFGSFDTSPQPFAQSGGTLQSWFSPNLISGTSIDDTRLFKRALTALEVTELYTKGLAGN